MGDTLLNEKDFLYVPEFRAYLESTEKKNGKKTGTPAPTILELETGVPGGGRRRKEGRRAA